MLFNQMSRMLKQKGPSKNALKESLMAVGFNFYLTLARMSDIEPTLTERTYTLEVVGKVYNGRI